ncbi:prepilin-type N-terminal cleavage/methylation domain-containing protein, partial [Arthrospira platensis SPKY1]|nr:prepilin-type N-terminal cleavage/methylation domain-containing protein [Arthrospira platensis SPKY1]
MTLIELLVVIAIIVILMGLVVGIAGSSQRGAAEAKTKAQIGQIVLELEKFRGDMGRYPNNLQA